MQTKIFEFYSDNLIFNVALLPQLLTIFNKLFFDFRLILFLF